MQNIVQHTVLYIPGKSGVFCISNGRHYLECVDSNLESKTRINSIHSSECAVTCTWKETPRTTTDIAPYYKLQTQTFFRIIPPLFNPTDLLLFIICLCLPPFRVSLTQTVLSILKRLFRVVVMVVTRSRVVFRESIRVLRTGVRA